MSEIPTPAFALIRQAIFQKKLISAVYLGLRREMCPHVLGWKSGKEHALFFQVGGESRKGLSPEGAWRCLDIGELSDVSVYDGVWRTGPGYYENPQSCVDKVEVQIPPLKLVAKP
jgi:uncharacterized protein